MSNTLLTSSIIAKESLAILANMLSFTSMVNTDYQDEFTSNMSRGYAPGQTINIKRPPRYQWRAGRVANPQATVETSVPLTLTQGGTDINFTSAERTLSVTQLNKKLKAAMEVVANQVDVQGLDLARTATFNTLGTPGTLPTTQALAVAAATNMGQRLDEMAAPRGQNRALVMNPGLNNAMVQGTIGLFNPQGTISKQYGNGMFVDGLGFNVAMDQNVARHTNGSQAVAGTNINGTNQTGASITVVATTGTITRGSKITLPGVNAVNPQNRIDTGSAAQFVVTADVPTGSTAIPISPAIVTSGAFQNVTASPTSGSPYTIFGTVSASYNCNVAFHQDAFTFASVPMWMPTGGVISVAQESYKGITMKVTDFYDGTNDNAIIRFDILYGWAATYPELAVCYAT